MHALIFLVVAFFARMFTSKDKGRDGEKMTGTVVGTIMLVLGTALGLIVLTRVMNGGSLLPHVLGPIILMVTGTLFLAHRR